MEQHIRRLRLSHVANVRDLGGYEAGGGVIRGNRRYRAGDVSGAVAGDWERLKAAGVRTILDLRSASELRAKPDRPPQGISWYHLPLQTEEIDLEHPADLAGLAFLKSLRESYVIMAGENTGLLAAALARLTASLDDGAVLFHCTAGKDRTGLLYTCYREFLEQYLSREEVCREDDSEIDYIWYTYGMERWGNRCV